MRVRGWRRRFGVDPPLSAQTFLRHTDRRRVRVMLEPRCEQLIWPTWAPHWVRCGSAIHPRTHLCWRYHHPWKDPAMADPIETATDFNAETAAMAAREAWEADLEAVRRRFVHHPPTGAAVVDAHESARRMGEAFALWLVTTLPDCAERRLAVDAVDLATMHANAAIARTQLQG